MSKSFWAEKEGEFTAWAENRPDTQGAGRSVAEAVGNVIISHSGAFDIAFEKNKEAPQGTVEMILISVPASTASIGERGIVQLDEAGGGEVEGVLRI